MPIYAYRCADCGLEKDVLQKFSDAPLDTCPSCGAKSFARQLTAPAFQLKGTGWYATDFRGDKKPKPAAADDSSGAASSNSGAAGDAAPKVAEKSGDKVAGDKSSGGKASGGKASGDGAPKSGGEKAA